MVHVDSEQGRFLIGAVLSSLEPDCGLSVEDVVTKISSTHPDVAMDELGGAVILLHQTECMKKSVNFLRSLHQVLLDLIREVQNA